MLAAKINITKKMSQTQPLRPQSGQQVIRYGDVFSVSGELASQPIAPQDAAAMQSAENRVFGRTIKGSVAAIMLSAAAHNERLGVVRHEDVTSFANDRGVTVTEEDIAGRHVIIEAIGGEVVAEYVHPKEEEIPASASDHEMLTIGDVLEAAARSAGDKPIDQSDVAAIDTAEMIITGLDVINPGGLGALARSAAEVNSRIVKNEDKIKLADILEAAKRKLGGNKPVRKEDAERVGGAEIRFKTGIATHPGGVGASMIAAARINEQKLKAKFNN